MVWTIWKSCVTGSTALLWGPEALPSALTTHDQDSDLSVMAKEYIQLDDLLICWKSHAHASNSCILITSQGWEAGSLGYFWMARLSAKVGRWWWNGYFSYRKENLIFQLTTKYTIQHSGKFEKLLSSNTEQIVCCCLILSMLSKKKKYNSLVCWHSTHSWMHSLISPVLTGHLTVHTWHLSCSLTSVAKFSYLGIWKVTCSSFTECDHVSEIHATVTQCRVCPCLLVVFWNKSISPVSICSNRCHTLTTIFILCLSFTPPTFPKILCCQC